MHKTKLIILRTVKYGETSLVVTAFTELFGIQTYVVNGVRSAKKAGLKAALYQPASLLEAEVYHNDKSSMHRIREAGRAVVFQHVLTDVVKNSIAVFMMELLYKLLKQPENNPELFYFCEDILLQLDEATPTVAANLPLFYSLHLSHFFGFRIDDNFSSENIFLDLQEGNFVAEQPRHPYFMSRENALISAEILRIQMPAELEQLKINHLKRRELLAKYMEYYSLHVQEFGQMRTLAVMQEVLG
jgi:DNA repair protein RecO (recombination protein O)